MAQVTGLFDLGYDLYLAVARKSSVDSLQGCGKSTHCLQDMFPREQPSLGCHPYYYTL